MRAKASDAAAAAPDLVQRYQGASRPSDVPDPDQGGGIDEAAERVVRMTVAQSVWCTTLTTLPSGARTRNRCTPQGSTVSGCTIS